MMRMGKGVIVQCDKCRDLFAKNLASRVRIKCKGIPNEAVNLIMKMIMLMLMLNESDGCICKCMVDIVVHAHCLLTYL